jgi:SAM-dependent methyltransferase
MEWPWEVVERDHDVQNPVSREKILLLGDYLRLVPGSRVLDLGCGKCGPALILAEAHGCHIFGVERRQQFAEEGRQRIADRGLFGLVTISNADAASLEPSDPYDAALCLGTSFIWGTMLEAAPKLREFVRVGGYVAIGEPFWKTWPLPKEINDLGYVSLEGTVGRLESGGLDLTGMIASSDDDWDHYESQHWRAMEEWLNEQPSTQDLNSIRERHEARRREYIGSNRSRLGWAIFVARRNG